LLNEVSLPISVAPVISYLHHAYILSIGANYKQFYPWFYSQYIQLRCYNNIQDTIHLDYINFYNYDFVIDPIPWLKVEKIPKKMINNHVNNVIDFINDCIDQRYYIYTYLDRYHIINRNEYQKHHQVHDCFFYGYNHDQRYLNTLGFDSNRNFGSGTLSYLEFKNAFHTESDHRWQNYVYLLKFNDDFSPEFDVKLVSLLLSDYLNARNTSEMFRMYKKPLDACFGLDVYSSIQTYIELVADEIIIPDNRAFHLLYEHKKCMHSRLVYMEEQGYIDPFINYASDYAKVVDEAQIIRMKMIKYIFTQNKNNLSVMNERLVRLKTMEVEVLSSLLQYLRL
jgi:hypothetical protein